MSILDKISDNIIFVCGNCGRRTNPYAEYEGVSFAHSPEEVFNYMQQNIPCPECHKEHKWEFRQEY